VHHAAARRAPVLLLADWAESLHPASALGLPSADELDRAEALRAALEDLPAGQRQAVRGLRTGRSHSAGSARSPPTRRIRLRRASRL
jgi:hypothetical protein